MLFQVLVKFSITDYGSQGKTCPNNVVDLNNLLTHQSYYTALSRSATAKGTIILQGFDPHKITGYASGALSQEICELQIVTMGEYTPLVLRDISWSQNSCGYDAALRILYSIWSENSERWPKNFKTIENPLNP